MFMHVHSYEGRSNEFCPRVFSTWCPPRKLCNVNVYTRWYIVADAIPLKKRLGTRGPMTSGEGGSDAGSGHEEQRHESNGYQVFLEAVLIVCKIIRCLVKQLVS